MHLSPTHNLIVAALRTAAFTAAAISGALSLCAAPESPDTILSIGEVEVVAKSPAQGVVIGQGGNVTLRTPGLMGGIRSLGAADALNTLRMIPGITASSDYASGLNVEGAEASQSSYSLDGAPVLFPYHFGGMFSVFNTPHLGSLTLYRTRKPIDAPERLGAHVDVATLSGVAEHFTAVADIGMLASSATVNLPLSRRASVAASVRRSYIDLLYSGLLRDGSSTTNYGLTDLNLTLNLQPSEADHIKVSAFANADRVRFTQDDNSLVTLLDWENQVASARWTHTGERVTHSHTLYFSRLHSSLGLDMPQFTLRSPSETMLGGVSSKFDLPHSLQVALAFEGYRFLPMAVESVGTLTRHQSAPRIHAFTARGALAWQTQLSHGITMDMALRLSGYFSHGLSLWNADPALTLSRRFGSHTVSLEASTATQYLHHVGLSEIGLASNFWIPATGAIPPQRMAGVSASYSSRLFGDALVPEVNVYWRRVTGAAEYCGTLLAAVVDESSPLSRITTCNGYNTGIDLTARYSLWRLSGWAGYSLGIARRRFAGYDHRYLPAAHEPMHSLKVLAQCSLGRGWDVSAFFNLCSGRRYTPIKAMYYFSGNLMCDYGPRNSAQMALRHRLDLAATWRMPAWRFGSTRVYPMICLSLLNAYGHLNEEMQYYVLDRDERYFRLVRRGSLFRWLPSLSFTLRI